MTAWERIGMTVSEWCGLDLDTRLRLAASCYLGWGYDLVSPRVAFASGIMPAFLVERPNVIGDTNCSTFTASVVMAAYPDVWDSDSYGDLQVFADRLPDAPFSPIEAVERAEVGVQVDDLVPGAWHLVQVWRRLGSKPSGHAFLVRDMVGAVIVLQAASGVGPCIVRRPGLDVSKYPAGIRYARLV